MSGGEHVFSRRVYLSDTNAEGNTYFANYFEWQGMAREDFFRVAVPDHMELLRSGIKLITVSAWMKFERETHLFDEVSIKIRTVSLKKMSMELEFTFLSEKTHEIVALGGQKLAFADSEGHLVPIPSSIRAGAETCLIEAGTPAWHMEVVKRHPSGREMEKTLKGY